MRLLIFGFFGTMVGCGGADDLGKANDQGVGADSGVSSIGDTGGGDARTDADRDGHTSDVDCDDSDAAVHPDATEVCDAVDNNCDGSIDEGVSDVWYHDGDGDGFGDGADPIRACEQPSSAVVDSTDCDDTDGDVFPGADEVCDDIDNDCDGEVDGENTIDMSRWYPDADGDGFGAELIDVEDTGAVDDDAVLACEGPPGHVDVTRLGDCDDDEPAAFPGGTEVCDDIDNDCDGVVDDDALDAVTYFHDGDGDGYGNPDVFATTCVPLSSFVDNEDDCDDARPMIYPGSEEFCNGVDDDCNGTIDDGFVFDSYYLDADGDGHGFGLEEVVACTRPAGYVTSNDDCDDDEFWANPDVSELCGDHIDNDCDGEIDEEFDTYPFYRDLDGDGFGEDGSPVFDCAPPIGHVLTNTDCNDSDATVNPGEIEACNGVDDDCNDVIDDGLPEYTWFQDDDGDGYGVPDGTMEACGEPVGYAPVDTDCNDDDRTTYPGAYEMCDEVDNDCNDIIDDDCGSSRILGAYAALTCDGSAASIREVADYIDVSYNSSGTWNDSTAMGFRIGDGEGTYYESCYYGSPWQQVSIEYAQGGSTFNHTGNFSSRAWSWTTDCSDTVEDADTAGVIHGWSVGSIYITKTEIWEDDGRVSRVWFDIDNLGSDDIDNLRVMFGVDPDHDYTPGGSYNTLNDVRDAGDYVESVSAASDWTLGFGMCDVDADDVGHTGWSTDADASFVDDETASGDRTMHWRHTEDFVSAGGAASFGFLVTVGQTAVEAEETYETYQPILCSGG